MLYGHGIADPCEALPMQPAPQSTPGPRRPAVSLDARTQRINPSEVRAMYQRTLNGWVMDNVRLGRQGLERPSARTAARPPASTSVFKLRQSGVRATG